MSKYSKEFIIKTCEEYLSCNSSKLELCNKYGIHYKNGKSIIDDQIPRYLEDGADAFLSTVGKKFIYHLIRFLRQKIILKEKEFYILSTICRGRGNDICAKQILFRWQCWLEITKPKTPKVADHCRIIPGLFIWGFVLSLQAT